jgi:hypothetical protein
MRINSSMSPVERVLAGFTFALLAASLIAMCFALAGCMPVPEHVGWREAVDEATAVARKEHLTVSRALAESGGTYTDPSLQALTPEQRQIWLLGRTEPLRQYDEAMREDRERYPTPFAPAPRPLEPSPEPPPVAPSR